MRPPLRLMNLPMDMQIAGDAGRADQQRCTPVADTVCPPPDLPVQEMQDALTSSEEEKNALKRQLAKLSKKYQQVGKQKNRVGPLHVIAICWAAACVTVR